MIESQRGEICRAHQGDERLRRDHLLLHEQLLEQNLDLREAHDKSLNEMERIEAISRIYVRFIVKKKIDRRSRHYP